MLLLPGALRTRAPAVHLQVGQAQVSERSHMGQGQQGVEGWCPGARVLHVGDGEGVGGVPAGSCGPEEGGVEGGDAG